MYIYDFLSNVIPIKSLDSEELDFYVRMSESQLLHAFEPGPGVFIAETELVISRALQAGYEPISFLVDENRTDDEIVELLRRFPDVKVYCGPNEVISELVGYKLTRGILSAMKRKKLTNVEDVCKNASRIAVLDRVMNPVNVGSLFRSAAALGIDAVLLTEGSSDPLYRRASRVGMGAAYQIPWTFLTAEKKRDAETEYVEKLKELGFTTVAMALRNESVSISDERLKKADKLAIILGNEGFGLADGVIKQCDYTALIPMYHNIDSLNVGVAGSLIFWELCKIKT